MRHMYSALHAGGIASSKELHGVALREALQTSSCRQSSSAGGLCTSLHSLQDMSGEQTISGAPSL